jgi:hypothetical protein
MTFGSNATIDSGDASVLSDAADALRNSGGFAEAIELYYEALPISVLNVDSRTHTRD